MTQSGWKIIFGHCEAVPKIVHVQMCLKLEVPEAAEQRIQTLFWPNIQPRRLEKEIATFKYMREHWTYIIDTKKPWFLKKFRKKGKSFC